MRLPLQRLLQQRQQTLQVLPRSSGRMSLPYRLQRIASERCLMVRVSDTVQGRWLLLFVNACLASCVANTNLSLEAPVSSV